ncbi:MAG: VOC family protein [Bacteroidota bacterium]
MEQRLTILTLGVSDLEKLTHFYENLFGWIKSDSSNEHITFFTLNGIVLSLYEKNELAQDANVDSKGNGFKGFTLAYNTRSENEVNDIIENLREKGVKIVKEPQKVHWGGYSSYISDLDGNLWEIAFNPYLKLDEKGSVAD